MNNTMTTTKTFWGITTLGLWLILGISIMTGVIDLTAFIGALTTTGMAAFGMYQMYNKEKAEDTVERQAELIQYQSTELHKLHIDNSKLQAKTKVLNSKLNEGTKEVQPKQRKSNKKVGK